MDRMTRGLPLGSQHEFFVRVDDCAQNSRAITIGERMSGGDDGSEELTPHAQFVELVRASILEAVACGQTQVLLEATTKEGNRGVVYKNAMGGSTPPVRLGDPTKDKRVLDAVKQALEALGVAWRDLGTRSLGHRKGSSRMYMLHWTMDDLVSMDNLNVQGVASRPPQPLAAF